MNKKNVKPEVLSAFYHHRVERATLSLGYIGKKIPRIPIIGIIRTKKINLK